jgi:ATP-dependent Zn protease
MSEKKYEEVEIVGKFKKTTNNKKDDSRGFSDDFIDISDVKNNKTKKTGEDVDNHIKNAKKVIFWKFFKAALPSILITLLIIIFIF